MGDFVERIIRYTRDMAIVECIDEIDKYCEENNITLGRKAHLGQERHITNIRNILESKCIKVNNK